MFLAQGKLGAAASSIFGGEAIALRMQVLHDAEQGARLFFPAVPGPYPARPGTFVNAALIFQG